MDIIKPRLTLPGVEVYIGNAIDVVKRLALVYGKRVNMVMTSPPYLRKRAYLPDDHPDKALEIGQEETIEGFVTKLADLFDAIGNDLLREDGSLWINLGDGFAGSGGAGGDYSEGGLREGQPTWEPLETEDIPDKSLMMVPERFALEMIRRGWRLRNKIIWFKGNEPEDGDSPASNGMPESADDRLKQTYELIFHFVRAQRYHYSLDEIREAHSPESIARTHRGRSPGHKWEEGPGDQTIANDMTNACHPLGRNPGDVWFIPTKGFALAHYATYNPAVVHRPTKATCPEAACRECGAPRVPILGRECEKCGAFVRRQAKRCDGCGHVRDWKKGRVVSERHMATDWSTPGAGAPRIPGNFKNNTVVAGHEPTCTCNAGWRGGIVLDPFGGSGSTAQGVFEARPPVTVDGDYCQPKTILIDLDERNLPIIEKRLTGRAKQGRKVDLSKYNGGFLAAAEPE